MKKITIILILVLTTLSFNACASKKREIPYQSPCACNYDIVKVG